jgi:hypothetical protein
MEKIELTREQIRYLAMYLDEEYKSVSFGRSHWPFKEVIKMGIEAYNGGAR